MSTIDRRISELEQFRERQEKRKGVRTIVEDTREFLESIDGQHDLDMRPGEDIMDVMTRRMQSVDGYDLSGMPGETLKAKRANVEPAYYGKIVVSAEARHAARAYFKLFDYL
jgi:hypothetical protein